MRKDCWAKGGGKEGQKPKGKGRRDEANVAESKAGDNDEIWMAEALDSDEEWLAEVEQNLAGWTDGTSPAAERLEGLESLYAYNDFL